MRDHRRDACKLKKAYRMLVIDVEIKKAILGRGETPIPGIEYCRGWRDFENMGIACVCVYDIVSHLSRVFLEEDLHDFENYISGKPTAGFNTKRFDNTLLHHHGKDVEKVGGPHYDILEQIWLAQGLDPDRFNPRTHGGWGLDAVCKATLGIAKTGHGALAPVWWQQGKRGKVIDYCLNDVWMEGSLLEYIIEGGAVCNSDAPGIYVPPPPGEQLARTLKDVRRMASAGEPLIATGSGEVGPSVSAGGLGIIR